VTSSNTPTNHNYPHDESEALRKLHEDLANESTDSLKLLNNLEQNPVCCVTHDEELSCVCVVWKQYATRAQLRFIHERILHLLQRHGANKILGDDTALPTIHTEDQAWIIENWMPRALAVGLQFVANKGPDAYFGKVAVSAVQSRLSPMLVLRSFSDLDEARDWLANAAAPG
jgi:hypothetical protein